MDAKKCDMCKKFYDEEDVKLQRVRIYYTKPAAFEQEGRVDICNECHDKILNMIAKEVR